MTENKPNRGKKKNLCQAGTRATLSSYTDMGARKADRIRANKRRAGLKGGPARAASLSPERRREIASKAAQVRNPRILVRIHPSTGLPTCLPLPEDVVPRLHGPLANCAQVTRTWLARERKRIQAILAQ